MTQDYSIIRTQKVKTLQQLKRRSDHNLRKANTGSEHAENLSPKFGGGVQQLAGSADAVAQWHSKMTAAGLEPEKIKKNTVIAFEVLMTASPQWFATASDKDREAWKDRSLKFIEKRYGAENLLSVQLHDDETTPHIHALFIPLVRKEVKRAGRPRKGREHAQRTSQEKWTLSAKDILGGHRSKMSELQTTYGSEFTDIGLQRGIPKALTGARNKSPARFRAEQERAAQKADEYTKSLKSLEEYQGLATKQTFEMLEEVSSQKALADEKLASAEAYRMGLDAVNKGEIVYRPAEAERTESLSLRTVEKPIIPRAPDALKRWKSLIQPHYDGLKHYAYTVWERLNTIRAQEAAVEELASKNAIDAKKNRQDASIIEAARRSSDKPAIPEITDIAKRNKANGREPGE